MDMKKLLTREKADAMCEKISKGLEENKIVGSANVIAYAMKEAWFAGFEEGRNTRSKCQSDLLPVDTCNTRLQHKRTVLASLSRESKASKNGADSTRPSSRRRNSRRQACKYAHS